MRQRLPWRGGLFLNLAGGIFGLFTAVILTAYFIIDGDRTFTGQSHVPLDHSSVEATLLRAKADANWLIGQTLLIAEPGLTSLVAS